MTSEVALRFVWRGGKKTTLPTHAHTVVFREACQSAYLADHVKDPMSSI